MPRPHPAGQGVSSSCAGWAFGYYAKSYLEAVEHGWMPINNDRCFSPSFIYITPARKFRILSTY